MGWYVYILECADATYYTGITTDIERRIAAHEAGTGAKYTKGRGPLNLIYEEECADRSSASKREIEIKALSKAQKLALISP
ncbi:MAG: endonuclease [Alphaproteobacteria bacterium]|nr:MAG: endonuclease [Alphaproteobacteria bacterium]